MKGWLCVVALVGLLVAGLAAAASAQTAEPPLKISADRMTGSRGPEGDVVLLHGHVRIVRGGTVITSETGTYERAVGMLYLRGNVKIVDRTSTITCDEASYSEVEDVVHLTGNVKAVDRDATLESPAATYDRVAGRADLYGGVKGRHRNQRFDSDSASYFRDDLLIEARGNVRGHDEDNDLTLRGREVDYDRGTREAEARGEPSLEARGDHGERAVITARVLKLNTETEVAEAVDSVHVKRDSLEARGDYGLFDNKAEQGFLVGHPRAWDDETTVTGDSLEFRTQRRELDQVIVRGNARMTYRGIRRGNEGETSLLTGDRVEVYFRHDDIDSLAALGNARNEYVAVAQPGKTPESNAAQGDTITMEFKDGKVDLARILGNAKGEYELAVNVADSADTAAAGDEVVRYDADMIEYNVPKDEIMLEDKAHLTYRDVELTARRVTFDSKDQTLVAEGEPVLVDRGEKVTGHLMTYDLENRVGNIYRAETEYEKGLYHGRRIRKVSDNELQVLSGDYTTCDLPTPHYHFGAHYMKIYVKDKLVAKPIVFYLKRVPLFALPFWIFPIRPGRRSGFLFPQVELGFNNRAGRFIRNAGYYWAPNDYFDITTSGDYYQFEPSWVLRAEGYYKLLYKFDGNFRTSYARNDGQQTEDWDLDADHYQDLTPRTKLSARASFVSSRDYNSSNRFGRPLSLRLNRFLTSNLAITHSAEWASINAVVDRRQDLDADNALEDPDDDGPLHGPALGTLAPLANLTESVPNLSVSFPTRTIGSVGFLKGSRLGRSLESTYLSFNARFLSFHERRGFVSGFLTFDTDTATDSLTVVGQRNTNRNGFASSMSLGDSRRLFGWINVQPSLSSDLAVFDHDELGNDVVPTGTWSASFTSSTSLYGTFQPRLGPVTGIRHIVSPRVSYTYSPDFPHLFYVDAAGRRQPRFSNFGGIGVSGFERQRLDFGLEQRLQVRLGSGEKVRRLDNLASLSIGSSYNFLYKEQGQRHPLAPLSASLFIQPPGLVNASSSSVIDPYEGRPLRSLSYNVGLDLASRPKRRSAAPELPAERRMVYYTDILDEQPQGWNLGLAYSYSGGYSDRSWRSSQTANVVLRTALTPKWGLNYSTSYDVTRQVFGIQQFALTRDLHCWTAQFSRTFAPDGETEYYFKLGLKEQREIYVERGSRTGSIGGIQ